MTNQTNLLTPKELQEITGYSYSTILRMTKAGILPVVRLGKKLRFPRGFIEDLEAEALAATKEAR